MSHNDDGTIDERKIAQARPATSGGRQRLDSWNEPRCQAGTMGTGALIDFMKHSCNAVGRGGMWSGARCNTIEYIEPMRVRNDASL